MSPLDIGEVVSMAPAGRSRNATPPSKLRRVVEVSTETMLSRGVAIVVGIITMLSTLFMLFAWLAGAMTTPKDIDTLRQESHATHLELQTLREEFQQAAITGLRPSDVNNHLSALDQRDDRIEERLRLDEQDAATMKALLGLGSNPINHNGVPK